MAKLNLSVPLVDEKGVPVGTTRSCYVLESDGETFKKRGEEYVIATITDPKNERIVKDAIIEALLSDANENPQAALSKEVKAKRYSTFYKISQAKDLTKVDLSSEEITTIKEVCWLAMPTLLAGQIEHILEGK
jgi:hypothetical protein